MSANERILEWLLCILLVFVFSLHSAAGNIRYSIPEEMAVGSFVGNIGKDLGLQPERLVTGRARLFSPGGSEYVALDREEEQLVVRERIDREQLCGEAPVCSFSFEIILESPIELYRVTVEILDINDNSPVFPRSELKMEISESAVPGARFSLESARDLDVGVNSLQGYSLHPTDHFALKVHSRPGGSKSVEMILQTPLDREKQEQLNLMLTAVDGGNPKRTGTVKINIAVLDANDNAPVFKQSVYRASVPENAVKGTLVITVSATDADNESNGHIQYYFEHATRNINELFIINPSTGDIIVTGELDFEKSKLHEIKVQAKDQGGLTDSSDVLIEVLDVNDNAPKMTVMSFSSTLPEDSVPGTVIAMINVQDLDSGDNGRVKCSIDTALPFKIETSLTNYYSVLTDSVLDREQTSEYNITVIAVDGGSPSLSSNQTLHLKISDVNDHAPQFEQETYNAYLMENNPPSFSVFSVKANDADWGANARVSYYIEESDLNGLPLSSYISINADSGVIYAVTPFDYEQIKLIKLRVKAQDAGSPPLSSNATVSIIIQDQNDNAPQVLYPVQTAGSLVAEMVPRSAEVGYLVTKVVAVDVDSGQNAWLSYKLLKPADRPLFAVGLQNGEIRTIRQVSDKDAVKQKLTLIVEDNGQPPRSASVNVNVAVADSFPEILSEFTDFTHDRDYNDDLTFYLILSLAVVSFLFIVSIITILSVKCYRWRHERMFYKSGGNLPIIPYYPPLYADVGGTGTLRHVYNYEGCGTTDSRRSDLKYGRPCSQNTLNVDLSGTGTIPRKVDADVCVEQKPPNTDWRFSQNQRPGPSGCSKLESAELRWTSNKRTRAGVPPEGAVGTGPWPNPPTEAEQLQALMAAANEVSEATATLGPGTMGLSTRYSPQFTLQHVPDYRQNVYIPGSTATLTANPQQQALPPPQAQAPPPTQAEAPKAAQTPASKKKSAKKEKK
ncbi:protocadherin gamma-A11-like isoform X28 [Paramormyrops kingsleyae]|uniref:protocadherin gamma-A11-like isoform X28 n=1 Tax=Paramormyrops kingsleyae TaxID=1676925 RepID=UPI003B96EDC0